MTASAMKSIIGMTTLAAALAGCSLAPKYERPVAPVEGAYPTGASYNAPDQARARADGLAASDVGWRDFYTDPLLQEVIAGALTNNRDLRVAALNVEVARRRDIQREYNEKHHISPTQIFKPIRQKLIDEYVEEIVNKAKKFETDVDYKSMPPKEVNKEVKRMEAEMKLEAENLNFERAAALRDKIREIKGYLSKQ